MDLAPFSFYLSAWEEDRHTIAQANIELDEKLNIVQDVVDARRQGNFVLVNKSEVDYVDVSPKQLVSVAASLVPFLEHDDPSTRAPGPNMQRQSVQLLVAEAPPARHRHGRVSPPATPAPSSWPRAPATLIDSVDSERIIVRVEGEHHPRSSRVRSAPTSTEPDRSKRSSQKTCFR